MQVRILALVALVFLAAGCGDFVSETKNSASSRTSQDKPSFLFVITSNHGSIQKNAQGEFTLTLDHSDIQKVLAFSDRPLRVVKHMTGEELRQFWSEGNNSFAKDHPNATVVINQHLQTVIITSLNMTQKTMTFRVEKDGPQSLVPMSGPVQVFLDSSNPYAEAEA